MNYAALLSLLSPLFSASCVLADALAAPASSADAQAAQITPLPVLAADEDSLEYEHSS